MTRYIDLQPVKDTDLEEYFAAQDVDDCVSMTIEKIEEYYAEMNRTGRINLYRNAFVKFYQGFILKGAVYHSGQEGELLNSYENHYANLITHMVNMVCQQKLSYEPQAVTSEGLALDQLKLAKGLLYQYANRPDIDLDGKLRTAAEMSQVFTECYVFVLWDKHKGRLIATDVQEGEDGEQTQGPQIKEGENIIEVASPFDVIVDTTLPSNAQKKWVIYRRWENKFDLAAEYPDWSAEIVHLTSGGMVQDTQLTYSISQSSDLLPVYYLFHEKSAAVPEGRLTKFIDSRIILADGDLGYREMPGYRIATRELWGSPYGYSRACDLLPIQETIDRLVSAIITNQLTFATQNILISKGSDIQWENLYGGLNVIEWDSSMGEAGKPAALQLTSTPQEVFTFLDRCVTTMGTLAGINEAIKGNPDLMLKGQVSGAALALMSSNSIQFNNDFQKAYVRLAEQVGSALLHNVQDFGFVDMGNGKSSTREGMSLSATNKYYRRPFGQKDLSNVDKVIVRYGNPLSQTTSGRMQIAEYAKDMGLVKTVADLLEVMETGTLEPALDAPEAQMRLIKEENEEMMLGNVPPVLWADDHVTHIPEHLAKIANLDVRKDAKIIQACKAHVDQHVQALRTMDPILAGLLHQPIIPPPAPPAAPPAQPRPAGPMQSHPVPSGPPARPGMPAQNNAGLPQSVPMPVGAP
jgi:hypothetical protein